MQISQVMTRDVRIASPNDNLQLAAQMMEDYDCGLLPVGEHDRLIGMLSDRDITVRGVARGLSPMASTVREVMTDEVLYIYDDDTLETAARSMSELQVRRLPVVDHDHKLVGIVSLGDLSLNEEHCAGSALNSISQPSLSEAYMS